MNQDSQVNHSGIFLWNPNAATFWSLLFFPVFGAWLHAKNWSALGDETKAKQSMYWVYGGVLELLLLIVPIPNYGPILLVTSLFVVISYFLGWYFLSARSQAKHVKEQLGGVYKKRGWAKPLGIATVGLALYMTANAALTPPSAQFNPDIRFNPNIRSDSDIQQESALIAFRRIENTSQHLGCWQRINFPEPVMKKLNQVELYPVTVENMNQYYCFMEDGKFLSVHTSENKNHSVSQLMALGKMFPVVEEYSIPYPSVIFIYHKDAKLKSYWLSRLITRDTILAGVELKEGDMLMTLRDGKTGKDIYSRFLREIK